MKAALSISLAIVFLTGTLGLGLGTSAAHADPAVDIDLHDPSGHAMDAFHRALAGAERGEGQARLMFYGASHVASDTFTGILRRTLQDSFGDSGHGFVLPAKPWNSYRHRDVNIDGTLTWWADWIGKSGAAADGLYGLAGVSITSNDPKDYASLSTTVDNRHGQRVSVFDIYYLEQPGGGSLDVRVDGRLVRRLATGGLVKRAAYYKLPVEDAGHKLELFPVGDGPVRLFGVAMDRETPGVVVDVVGINGYRAANQLKWNEDLQAEHIRRRRPDLITLAYGTNESGDDTPIENYEADLRAVLGRIKRAAPEASCLLIGPSDRPLKKRGRYQVRPRQALLIDAQKRIGAEFGCAFFDLVEFMGGPLSMVTWVGSEPRLGAKDHVHYTAAGYKRLAEVLHAALMKGYSPGGTRSR